MIYTCTFNPAIDYKLEVNGFIEGDLNRTNFNKFVAGGKGINVSIVLNNLGVNNVLTGFIGGFTGNFVKQYLMEKYEIESQFIEISDLTRVNVKVNNNGSETEINALGPVVNRDELDQLLNMISKLDNNDILAIGGSPAKGEASSYLEIVKLCHNLGIDFVIDTNNGNLLQTLKYSPLLVKPNTKELRDLFEAQIETEEEIIHYAKELVSLGAKNVIVSRGAEGSLFVNEKVIYKAPVIKGDVKNTVGAGDSMVAGFIKAYIEGETVVNQYKMAIASGTATAFSFDLATKDEVDKIFKEIQVEVMNDEN